MNRDDMMTTIIFTLLLGVAFTRAKTVHQSEAATPNEQLMASQESIEGQSGMETPQVVLQLKYDRGELNKIYLAQFRKSADAVVPAVPARTSLCADLCHAGLGGPVCGATCPEMIPVGLEASLKNPGESSALFGEPRTGVCPTLCQNHLGQPLCNCSGRFPEIEPTSSRVDWSGVCSAFCQTDGYTIGGCPRCEETATNYPTQPMVIRTSVSRILNSEEGWVAWCSVQCRQGHGGAACNCDRSPLQ